jgi:peptidoglycan/LPS O-acetylase OafA/YrhL
VKHVAGIDTLRGVSVILVVSHHVAIRLPLAESRAADHLPARLLAALSWNGYEAVVLFFVVSGFLLTAHTLDRDGAPGDVDPRAFWGRRIARIVPPLLVLLAVLSAAHLLGVPKYRIIGEHQSLVGALASASFLWLNVYEGLTGYLPAGWDVLWSLSIEEAFYLGFPLALIAARREWVVAALAGAFALTMPVTHGWTPAAFWGAPQVWHEKAYLPAMSAIAAGVAAAVVARHLAPLAARDLALQGVGVAAVVAVLVWGDVVWGWLGEGTLLVLVAGAATFAIGAHGDRARPPSRLTAPIRSFGRWSYEIYLTHVFVVLGVVGAFGAAGLGKPDGHWGAVAALAGSWLLGRAFAAGVSEPANAWVRTRLAARHRPEVTVRRRSP